jgi:hypothetical protein
MIAKIQSFLDHHAMNCVVLNATILVIEKENVIHVRIKVNMELNVIKIAVIVLIVHVI